MGRSGRVRPLLERDLARLPLTCPRCVLGSSSLVDADSGWASAAVDRFGLCGVVAVIDHHAVGYLLLSPALNVPATHPIAHGARTPDSAVVMSVRVLEDHRGSGVGKHLVQSAAARLLRQANCLEAIGTSGNPSCQTPPLNWLESVGFVPCDDPVGTPAGLGPPTRRLPGGIAAPVRMRLDLSSTVTWRPDLQWAKSWVGGWAGRPAQPEHPRSRT